HSGQHQSLEPDRKQAGDENWIRRISLAVADILVQSSGDDSRQNENENGQDLQIAGEDRPATGFLNVASGKHALHDMLVGTPVPNAENRRTEDDARPWEILVIRRLPHGEEIGRD